MRTISLAEDLKRLLVELGRNRPLRDPIAASAEFANLPPAQIHTLMWLGYERALPMGELARRLAVSVKTVTGVADRLEKAGFVRRERDRADRRVIRLALTPRGAASFAKLDTHFTDTLERLIGHLDGRDVKVLIRILGNLRDRFAAADKKRNAR